MKLNLAPTYGEPHVGNGIEDFEAFYFNVRMPGSIGSLGGYVTREQFNWLAQRLGTPSLDASTDIDVSQVGP